MAIVKDPEENEKSILHALVDFSDRRVLEVGCGAGRLTWRYADQAAHVTGIDPSAEELEKARLDLPARLAGRVDFIPAAITDFAHSHTGAKFDLAIFAWSL